jgi:hypothetical protein
MLIAFIFLAASMEKNSAFIMCFVSFGLCVVDLALETICNKEKK